LRGIEIGPGIAGNSGAAPPARRNGGPKAVAERTPAGPKEAGPGPNDAGPNVAGPKAPAPEPPVAAAAPRTETEGTDEERSAETEAGKGESVCAYGVEVVELLEMEPLDGTLAPRRSRPYYRYASVAFFAVFVLGLLNAAAVLIYYSPVLTPDELSNGTCELAGEVQDSRGDPVANATIVLTDSTLSTFTNSDGWYVLKGIPAGTHRVEAAAPGYGTMSIRVELRPNLLRTVDFTLEKGGPVVRLDESAAPDFGQANSSYVWATPVLLALSVMALAAALLALRRKVSRTVLALGAASALSFGFGAGTALAIAGVLLAALQRREKGGPPLKRLRVGISYPQKPAHAPARATPAPGDGAVVGERYSLGVAEQEAAQSVEAIPEGGMALSSAAGRAAGRPPEAPGPAPEETGRPAQNRADIEEVEVYLKERALRAQMASAEIEPSATLGRGEVDRETAPRPRRFVRRSKKGRVLCFICVNEIQQGQEYLRCSCGKTMHVKCLREPRCPDCGCAFRKEG
jgi:hypothetical protein